MFFLSRAISSFYEPSYVVVNTRIIPSNKLIKLGGGGGHSFFFSRKRRRRQRGWATRSRARFALPFPGETKGSITRPGGSHSQPRFPHFQIETCFASPEIQPTCSHPKPLPNTEIFLSRLMYRFSIRVAVGFHI